MSAPAATSALPVVPLFQRLLGAARRAKARWRRGSGAAHHASVDLEQGRRALRAPSGHLSLNVYVPSECGLACTFCGTARASGLAHVARSAAAASVLAVARDLAADLVARAQGGENIRIMVQGRDVLNAPDSLEILSVLAAVPGADVTVLTPGTRLATTGFAAELARAAPGLTMGLTLHGSTAERHDAIAGRAGAFAEFHAAVAAARAAGLGLRLTTIIVRDNVEDVPATLQLAQTLAIPTWLCAFEAHPEHNAAFVTRHMPSYAAIGAALPPRRVAPLREVIGVPLCVLPAGLVAHAQPSDRGRPLAVCAGCERRGAGCNGPPPHYVERFGEAEFKAMRRGG